MEINTWLLCSIALLLACLFFLLLAGVLELMALTAWLRGRDE